MATTIVVVGAEPDPRNPERDSISGWFLDDLDPRIEDGMAKVVVPTPSFVIPSNDQSAFFPDDLTALDAGAKLATPFPVVWMNVDGSYQMLMEKLTKIATSGAAQRVAVARRRHRYRGVVQEVG